MLRSFVDVGVISTAKCGFGDVAVEGGSRIGASWIAVLRQKNKRSHRPRDEAHLDFLENSGRPMAHGGLFHFL